MLMLMLMADRDASASFFLCVCANDTMGSCFSFQQQCYLYFYANRILRLQTGFN